MISEVIEYINFNIINYIKKDTARLLITSYDESCGKIYFLLNQTSEINFTLFNFNLNFS